MTDPVTDFETKKMLSIYVNQSTNKIEDINVEYNPEYIDESTNAIDKKKRKNSVGTIRFHTGKYFTDFCIKKIGNIAKFTAFILDTNNPNVIQTESIEFFTTDTPFLKTPRHKNMQKTIGMPEDFFYFVGSCPFF